LKEGSKNPCGLTLPRLPGYAPRVTGYWIPKGEHEKSFTLAKRMVEAITDFSWLSRGDRVLVKLALNSGNPYPRTTDPWLLDSMLKMLREKGARVVVGDSGGCGNVRWAPSEKRGATRELAEKAGLLPVIIQNGAVPVFFEEQEYDSFLETLPSGAHHWKKPMRITSAVEGADHIIYVPRISSHILADFTAGLKVGLPRDTAFKLATQTLVGTSKLLRETGMGITELRDAVTTPAGTTIAGIYELEKGSFRTSVINAVEAATQAAERVAKKFESEH